MNAQIPGYSAVYDNRGYCPSCSMQQAGGYTQIAMPSVTGQGTPAYQQNTMPAAQQGMQNTQLSTLPITDMTQPMPMTTESMQYLNGFLRAQIGKRVRVEFLIGTNTFTEKSGKLLEVGANYILLQEAMTDDLLVCDFYNIKFVTLFQ